MKKETVLEIAFKGAVDNFSENYTNSIEKKESFTIQDIQTAFKSGAMWAPQPENYWGNVNPVWPTVKNSSGKLRPVTKTRLKSAAYSDANRHAIFAEKKSEQTKFENEMQLQYREHTLRSQHNCIWQNQLSVTSYTIFYSIY